MPTIDESETATSPQLQPPSPGVWWNANSRGNSFTSTSLHPSLIVAPLFADQDGINAVPAPPASSHPDYQPMRTTPADLAQLELNLHYHIDSGFNSLTKLFHDKTDRIFDQLNRRLEALEIKVEKDIKNIESQVTDVKANLIEGNKATLKELDATRDCFKGLDFELELIHGSIEGKRYRRHFRQGSLSGSKPQIPNLAQAMPRRSHDMIAHETPENFLQSQAQSSVHSSQGNRSNPLSSGRTVSSNKSNFAQTEDKHHKPPDLRDHPAFANEQSSLPLDFSNITSEGSGSVVKSRLPLFQTPSFRDGGWYKQAYGQ